MPYLIFSGMQYEAAGGIADLETVITTKEGLLDWGRANLPCSAYCWVDVVEVTELDCHNVDEDELVRGRIARIADGE